jgi:hypothetical protein
MTQAPSPRPETETIRVDQVVGAEEVKLERLTPTQSAAFRLALGVGWLILVVTLVTALDWGWWGYVPPPSLTPGGAGDGPVAKQIQDYQALLEVKQQHALAFFDSLVIKAFLPIFTAILGYLFGTQNR